MFVVYISFRNTFFLKYMFNQLYIKEKSLSSCLMYVFLIWGVKSWEMSFASWSEVQSTQILSDLDGRQSSFLRWGVVSVGFLLNHWDMIHLFEKKEMPTPTTGQGTFFSFAECSGTYWAWALRTTRTGRCLATVSAAMLQGPDDADKILDLHRGEDQDAAHLRAPRLVCKSSLQPVLPCAPSFSPLHLISSLFPWSVRNSFWPGHVVYFQTCVQLA